MTIEKIDKIKQVSERLKALQVDRPDTMDTAVMRERFETLLRDEGKKTNEVGPLNRDPNTAVSPMETARQNGTVASLDKALTPESITSQVRQTSTRIEALKKRVETPDVTVKPSMTGMLRKKLLHIDSSIESALQRAGATESDLQASKAGGREIVDNAMNPIHRFIGLLTHGQQNLQDIELHMESLRGNNQLDPTMLMSIQLKVARVQQEIELFTSLLNKALESTKTIMNIQV
jgi:hypothetical protein